MPKVPSTRAGKARSSKQPQPTTKKPRPARQNPKDSHLYTDDNPSTTLHGTGFKDAATARHTLSIISARSLTYQYQVVNTMYHRAKHHPAMRKATAETTDSGASGMKDAMAIFRTWLDETYPGARERRKEEGREFKPLLGNETVQRYLDRINALDLGSDEDDEEGDHGDREISKEFARIYVDLPKGKRLANVLVDDTRPEGEDWEVRRERALVRLNEVREGSGEDGLWSEKGGVSPWHLACIAWAWSPVGEKKLPS